MYLSALHHPLSGDGTLRIPTYVYARVVREETSSSLENYYASKTNNSSDKPWQQCRRYAVRVIGFKYRFWGCAIA